VKRPKTAYVPEQEEEFSPLIPEENFLIEYNEDMIRDIWCQQAEMCDFLKKHGKSKHLYIDLMLAQIDYL
jgi:hypothetical protein